MILEREAINMRTFHELTNMVHKYAKEMGVRVNGITVNNRLKTRTIARANLQTNELQFNKAYVNFSDEQLILVIKHELLHLKTNRGDDDVIFMTACMLEGVPLSGGIKIEGMPKRKEREFKYFPYCIACQAKLQPYKIMSATVKGIMENPKDFFCPECGVKGRIRIGDR